MPFREPYTKALELLGRAFNSMIEHGFEPPVLVGGGAVEFYTSGAIASGDFDIVAANDTALESALLREGFRKEDRAGRLQRGYYHPELAIGIEVVGAQLFDGYGDRSRILLVRLNDQSQVAIVSIEDLIADRMGQFCSSPQRVGEMLEQALRLLELAGSIDEAYLDERIRYETSGELDLAYLKTRSSRP
jgi:hypothetical protein